MKGQFKEEDKIRVLLWSNRHCCLCGKACGTDIEIAHIIPRGANKSWEIDNAIPLCYECHAEIGRYNRTHPRGNKYRPEELKGRREQVYEEQTRHLVPPIHFEITQNLLGGGRRTFPDVGFNLSHLGDSLPVRVRVVAKAFLDQNDLGRPSDWSPLYKGEKLWNMNPRSTIFGHFTAPADRVGENQRFEIRVTISIIDQYEREHHYLPRGYVYMFQENSWFAEP